MNPSILERLKQETQANHADVERRVDLAGRLRTSPAYRMLLEDF
jgi:heme oxygenase